MMLVVKKKQLVVAALAVVAGNDSSLDTVFGIFSAEMGHPSGFGNTVYTYCAIVKAVFIVL